ncbi:MAG: glucose 1-dehydrogenase [Thermodesulfobacteriota bacterium]|jgi:2-deoxy-D-gluconate 3-dehydrogenase
MGEFQYKGFDLTDRVAIVTGSGTGIGKAIALGMAQAGADVVLMGRRIKPLKEVAKQIKTMGRKVICFSIDVRNLPKVRSCVNAVVREFGKIDILVNNAAVAIHEDLEDATEKTWNETIDINLKGTFFCAHAVGKVMIQQRKGKIINILSNCSFVAEAGIGIYCASKGGLLMITRCLATEWGKYGINVNGIGPAFILTPMNEPLLKDKHFVKWSSNRIPFHRMGKPDEMVGAAIYLASDAASFVNGAVVMVDGGFTAC